MYFNRMLLELIGIVYVAYTYQYLSQFLCQSGFCGCSIDMLSQGEGDGAAVGVWRREDSQILICFFVLYIIQCKRAIKCIKGETIHNTLSPQVR